jgi:filamentous hemagglutinin
MNKNRHRVVFNAARGLRVAVAECARSAGKATTTASATAVLITTLLLPAQAQIAADPSAPGNQRPTILSAPNGVPLVNIQTPSAAGVSRNTYRQFDVNAPGAILNNSRTNVQTQLGGWVQGNPWLATGGARIILNEVNSTHPSYLNGTVEVAGQRAEVIIANPAGIQVNGGGFINAAAVTLTTGTPVMNAGALESFRVQGGQVRIEGLGLDTRTADHTTILTRTMQVNAGIWANELRVVAGAGESNVDASGATLQTTPLAGVGPAPTFLLDVAAIGGMYAGKIHLVGTEAGLGVNNGGVISANQTFTLNANGGLTQTSGARLYADDIAIQTQGVRNEGGAVIAARDSLTITAAQIHNTEGAELLSLGGMDLHASGRIENRSARIEAQGQLSITTPVLINANDHFETELLAQPGQRYLRLRHGGVDYEQHQLGLNFAQLDHYHDQSHYAVLLPSTDYPFTNYPALAERWAVSADGRFQVQLSRTSEMLCSGTDCNPTELETYAASHGIWQRLGVTPPGPAPVYTGPNCDDDTAGCSHPDWAEYTDWRNQMNQYNAHKYQQQNALDQKITAYNDNVRARTLNDWVVIDATSTDYNPRVLSSAPGQIVSGGDMTLNVSTELLNHNSEILAGGALKVSGVAVENRGSDVIARTELSGQMVLSQFHDDGEWNNDDRLYSYAPYHAVQERGQPMNVARSDGGQAIPPVTPASGLFQSAPNPQSAYLIETDPLFANHRQWLGSDYLLNALPTEPATLHKRLGDGFYEQRLIREQVGQLTGQRFLGDYRDDEAQFLALMNAGLTFAQEHQLRPGIALTAEQVAALTSDIVWLVAEDVTLPDGRTEKALVPRVYLAPRAGDLAPSGALIAGNTVHIQLSGDALNSGTIAGRQLVQINAGRDITHSGKVTTEGVAVLQAGRDISIAGGEIRAVDAIVLDAGRDLDIASTTRTTTNQTLGNGETNTYERTGIDRQARLYVSGEAGVILAQAGRDITLTGADIANDGQGGTLVTAGRDLDLGTVRTSATDDVHWNQDNRQRTTRSEEVGTRINSAGDIQLQAGRDLNARAANVQTEGDLSVQAGRDVNILAGEQTLDFADAHHKSSSGFLSSGSVTTRSTVNTSDALASHFGGRTVDIQGGQDLTVQGSNVISDQGTHLQAGRDVHITAAQTRSDSTHFREEKSSGLLASGGGFMLGNQQQSTDQQRSGVGAAASTAGAIQGDVTIVAGRHYRQTGSDVIAAGAPVIAPPPNEQVTGQADQTKQGGKITVIAQDIQIIEARTSERSRLEEKTRQSGISIGAGGALVEAAQSIGQTIEATDKTEDGRMKALGASAAGMQAYNAGASIAADPSSAVGITFSLGASSSTNTLEREANNARGSSLSAAGDVRLIASGAGEESDILVRGSQVKAGDTVTLSAEGDIDLSAAKNTAQERSRSENSNASVSATYNGSWSFGASAQSGRGAGDGEEVIHSNTRIEAGKLVQIQSGGDTTLRGALVAANTVKADVGGDLIIESLQDTSVWREENSQNGGSASSSGGASASASRTQIHSDYASVGEQSGIRVGDGGFQVSVQGKTELIGGAITSTQVAVDQERNRFDSVGGLTLSDIHNSASFEANSVGVSVGVGSQLGSSGAGIGSDKGSASSTTVAAISGIAGNKDARTGDAETGLAPIFDKEKVREEVEAQVVITKAFGQQAGKAIGRYGNEQLAKADKLKNQAASETDPAIRQALISEANALEDTWKEGGARRVALHMVAGLASGGIGGAAGAGLTQTALPAMGDHIAALDLPVEIKQAMVQTIAVALGAAVGGSAGAATGLSATSQNYLSATDLRNKHQKLDDCRSAGDAACELKVLREYELKNAKNTGAIDYRSVLSESALQAERALLELALKDPALSDAAKAEARRSIKELDTAINVIQRSPVLRDAAELGLIALDVIAMGKLAVTKALTAAAVRELVLARTGKEISEIEAARIANGVNRDWPELPQALATSSGIVIQASSGKTTTVLGGYIEDMRSIIKAQTDAPKSMGYLDAKDGGFNVLNVPDDYVSSLMKSDPEAFWDQINRPFIDAAMARGDEIYLATRPDPSKLIRSNGEKTGFGREIEYLIENGYKYNPLNGKMTKH